MRQQRWDHIPNITYHPLTVSTCLAVSSLILRSNVLPWFRSGNCAHSRVTTCEVDINSLNNRRLLSSRYPRHCHNNVEFSYAHATMTDVLKIHWKNQLLKNLVYVGIRNHDRHLRVLHTLRTLCGEDIYYPDGSVPLCYASVQDLYGLICPIKQYLYTIHFFLIRFL